MNIPLVILQYQGGSSKSAGLRFQSSMQPIICRGAAILPAQLYFNLCSEYLYMTCAWRSGLVLSVETFFCSFNINSAVLPWTETGQT